MGWVGNFVIFSELFEDWLFLKAAHFPLDHRQLHGTITQQSSMKSRCSFLVVTPATSSQILTWQTRMICSSTSFKTVSGSNGNMLEPSFQSQDQLTAQQFSMATCGFMPVMTETSGWMTCGESRWLVDQKNGKKSSNLVKFRRLAVTFLVKFDLEVCWHWEMEFLRIFSCRRSGLYVCIQRTIWAANHQQSLRVQLWRTHVRSWVPKVH